LKLEGGGRRRNEKNQKEVKRYVAIYAADIDSSQKQRISSLLAKDILCFFFGPNLYTTIYYITTYILNNIPQ
jgi:hypothetical protein